MRLKKLISLLYPPVWVTVLLTVMSTVALVYTFVGGYEAHPFAYAVYVLSFYILTVIVMGCIKIVPKKYSDAKHKVYSNPMGERFMTDMKFRTHISLYCSLGVNLIYVAINVVSGFWFNTAWFFVLAFYYTILAVMRFLLLRFVNRAGIGNDHIGELRRSRLCGCILLLVNLALSGAVLMILYQDKGYEYNGFLIYVMAAYTFYITTLAVINLVKYRRLGSPVMLMAKIINMAGALVSLLILETAMFSQFGGDMSAENQRLMIVLTGAGVSIAIVTMSVYGIVSNSREIKRITKNKAYGE